MKHLSDANMTYSNHLKYAWLLSLKLLGLSIVAAIHGVLPFALPYVVSAQVDRMNKALGKAP